MKIDFVSDLHLEFLDFPDFSREPGGDILLLAGDITTAAMFRPNRTDADARSHSKYMKSFKKDLLDKYAAVFYVMGNHEHYNSIFKHTKAQLEDGFRRHDIKNLKILDNDVVMVDDIKIIGCTLWSSYFGGNPISMQDCELGMMDYRLIGSMDVDDMNYYNRHDSRTVTAEFLLNEHRNSVQFIRNMLNSNTPTLILTHHAPTLVSLNKEHAGNGLDGAYASDLSDLILGYPQIRYWVHGHTHTNVHYSVGDYSYVVSNQRGYIREKSHRMFNGVKSIEI